MTGTLPTPPVAKNTIYATKPSGWSKMYAYVYTGDGATAKNNAAWPGVEMVAATTATRPVTSTRCLIRSRPARR